MTSFSATIKCSKKDSKTNNWAHFYDCSKINRIWKLTFLQTNDTFHIWTRLLAMCQTHISTKHVISNSYYIFMTFISGSGSDGGGAEGEMAAKPLTTVQPCVSTFACEKTLDFFKEISGHLQLCLWQPRQVF